jgi:uncharacterized membrane protein YdjX (TVP38/TMEM64 family)
MSSLENSDEIVTFIHSDDDDMELPEYNEENPKITSKYRKAWVIIRLIFLVLLTLFGAVTLIVFSKDILKIINSGVEEANDLGYIAILIYYPIFIFSTVIMLPTSTLLVAAGFIWGPWIGMVVGIISVPSGCIVSFLIARYIFRDPVEHLDKWSSKFGLMRKTLSHTNAGFIVLTRASPIFPHNLLNYVLGVTEVSLLTFTWTALFGSIPYVMMYVLIGSASKSFIDASEKGLFEAGWQHYLYIVSVGAVSLGFTGIATFLLARKAKKIAMEKKQLSVDIV